MRQTRHSLHKKKMKDTWDASQPFQSSTCPTPSKPCARAVWAAHKEVTGLVVVHSWLRHPRFETCLFSPPSLFVKSDHLQNWWMATLKSICLGHSSCEQWGLLYVWPLMSANPDWVGQIVITMTNSTLARSQVTWMFKCCKNLLNHTINSYEITT